MTNRERLAHMSDKELSVISKAGARCYIGHTGYGEWLKQDFVESMEVTEE